MSGKDRKTKSCGSVASVDGNRDRTGVGRREFLQVAGAASAALVAGPLCPAVAFGNDSEAAPEDIVKSLHESLSAKQKSQVCFDWNHRDPKRGLLRTRIAANWKITKPTVKSEYFTAEQQHLIRAIFEGIVHPDWHARFDKQLQDDTGGFGNDQSIAIFGEPGTGKYQFALTGRHMTVRCDGNSAEHVAFGGPIFYGHAADGFNEKPNHPGNVFWAQAVAANDVFKMLNGDQRRKATVAKSPSEGQVAFQGSSKGRYPGISVFRSIL